MGASWDGLELGLQAKIARRISSGSSSMPRQPAPAKAIVASPSCKAWQKGAERRPWGRLEASWRSQPGRRRGGEQNDTGEGREAAGKRASSTGSDRPPNVRWFPTWCLPCPVQILAPECGRPRTARDRDGMQGSGGGASGDKEGRRVDGVPRALRFHALGSRE